MSTKKTNVLEIVREYFPKTSKEEAVYILWNETGWPCFWETNDSVACLRKQLEHARKNKGEANLVKKPVSRKRAVIL